MSEPLIFEISSKGRAAHAQSPNVAINADAIPAAKVTGLAHAAGH